MTERLSTKVTRLNKHTWGCRVFLDGQLIVEGRVNDRRCIGGCFKDLLRTLDKLGVDSKMASASRHRQSSSVHAVKHIWKK